MNNIDLRNKYVSFNLAVLAKKHGFDIETPAYYTFDDIIYDAGYMFTYIEYGKSCDGFYVSDDWNHRQNNDAKIVSAPWICSAPEKHQLKDWIFKKYGVTISAHTGNTIDIIDKNGNVYKNTDIFESFPEALDHAMIKILTDL